MMLAYQATPLGMGYGRTRFSSLSDAFKLLYFAENLATAVAETVIRDRFEGGFPRLLADSDIVGWGATTINAVRPLRLVDLRAGGCFRIGISTDITGAKLHNEAREFSRVVHDETKADGILYSSRLTAQDCVCVYERAVGKLTGGPVHELERLADLIPELKSLQVGLLTR